MEPEDRGRISFKPGNDTKQQRGRPFGRKCLSPAERTGWT